jgi:hypothetical protein
MKGLEILNLETHPFQYFEVLTENLISRYILTVTSK